MTAHQTHLSHPKYRPDIDGLRAIAVLAVVAFHAFPNWIKGGFIGVDVFFVISGYLISTIIFENLDKGTFRFSEFYARRIKRIFPALLLVLVTCFIFGWFVLIGDEYKRLGTQVFAGSFFTSNFLFWRMAGYFDKWAYAKPLLNLWSLGIEEQFYIVWPLVLWFGYKRRYNLLIIGVVIGSASFWLNVYQVNVNSIADFYSPLTRFWELMSGSILAWATLYKSNFLDNKLIKNDFFLNSISVFAFVLIIFGFLYINNDMGFPGVWALIPVLGSVLLIYSGPKAIVNRTLLSNNIAVWFGLISFPLYLWHWPLLSFARILHSYHLSISTRISCVFISIILAWLTYKFIELPIRHVTVRRHVVIQLVFLMILIGFTGSYTYYKNGFIDREVAFSIGSFTGGPGVTLLSNCGLTSETIKLIPVCQQDSRTPIRYALLGDSKASAMWNGLVRTSDSSGRWLFIGGNGPNGAPVPVISDDEIYKNYQSLTRLAVRAISDNNEIKVVILVTATRALFQHSQRPNLNLPEENFDRAYKGLKSTIEVFRASHKKVILVVDNPTLADAEDCHPRVTSFSFVNHYMISKNSKCEIMLNHHIKITREYKKLLNELRNDFPDEVYIFDPTDIYCDQKSGICSSVDNHTGKLLYSYSDHISDYASGLVGIELNKFLEGIR